MFGKTARKICLRWRAFKTDRKEGEKESGKPLGEKHEAEGREDASREV